MKIDRIEIACYHRDILHLRRCVASIRYWYPLIPITLIKDEARGSFSTTELETTFGVNVQGPPSGMSGWGWTKLAPFLDPSGSRILVLDADTVFLGPVLDFLETFPDDFLVTGILEPDEQAPLVSQHYITPDRVRDFDPAYRYPGFCFNTGQMVITSGIITRADFESVVGFADDRPKVKFDVALRYTDQGALNYLLHRAMMDGRASVRYLDFWRWPATPDGGEVTTEKLARKEGIPAIMHWAGIKPTRHSQYARGDILDFYDDFYYRMVDWGKLKKVVRRVARSAMTGARLARQSLLRMARRKPNTAV